MGYAFSIGLEYPQIIDGHTQTKVEFGQLLIGDRNDWNNAENKWIAPECGVYVVELHLAMTMGKQGHSLQARIVHNVQQVGAGFSHQSKNACAFPKCLALLKIEKGDFIEPWAWTNINKQGSLIPGIWHSGLNIWSV